MQQVLAQMLSKYQIRDIDDKKNAIKERDINRTASREINNYL